MANFRVSNPQFIPVVICGMRLHFGQIKCKRGGTLSVQLSVCPAVCRCIHVHSIKPQQYWPQSFHFHIPCNKVVYIGFTHLLSVHPSRMPCLLCGLLPTLINAMDQCMHHRCLSYLWGEIRVYLELLLFFGPLHSPTCTVALCYITPPVAISPCLERTHFSVHLMRQFIRESVIWRLQLLQLEILCLLLFFLACRASTSFIAWASLLSCVLRSGMDT